MNFSLFTGNNLLFCSFKVPDGKLPSKSRTIGFIDSDHILFAKHQALLNSFRFIAVMGWQLTLMFICCVLIIPVQLTLRDSFENYKARLNSWVQRRRHNYYYRYFFASNFRQNLITEKGPSRNYYYFFTSNLWQTLMAIFGQISLFEKRKSFLLLLWVFVIFVLLNLFTGDLIGAMSVAQKDVVIDSWDDLIKRKDVKTIITFNLEGRFTSLEYAQSVYFPEGGYKEALTSRLDVREVDEFLNKTAFVEHLKNANDGKQAILFHRATLRYYSNNYSKLHVSEFGGRREPYFLLFHSHMTPSMLSAVDAVIVSLVEGGVYEKWMESSQSIQKEFNEETSGDLPEKPFFYLLVYGIIVSAFILLLEFAYIFGLRLFRSESITINHKTVAIY